MKKTVKAWAVIAWNDEVSAFSDKQLAEMSFDKEEASDKAIVPCNITYTLPKKARKAK